MTHSSKRLFSIMNYQRMKVKPCRIILVFVLSVIVLSYHIIYSYIFELSITRYRLIENSRQLTNNNATRTINVLYWTDMWEDHLWNMKSETSGKEYFESLNCPVTNCLLTHDKNFLEAPHLYDALIFHSAEAWRYSLPKTRSPNQYYIMATMEAPPELKHNLRLDANFFNLTMTYRLDSDIVWNYGNFIDKRTNKFVAPAKNVVWRNPENVTDKEIHSLVLKKKRPIAWFVSHCNTHSRREDLVKEIQKSIDVDVYGKCGTLKCPRNSIVCNTILNTTYYFYFSFENGLCNDLITEKFYNAMNFYVIPVLFNGIHNMEQFAPPKSYINANEFNNVSELVDYLKFLIKNPEEYMKYFWWKKYYRIDTHVDKYTHCNLCLKLNELLDLDRGQYYIDISKWFYKNSCNKPTIKY